MAPSAAVRRRAVLAGLAGGVAGLSGCIGELRNLAGRQPTRQLSLSISTLPAANDPYAVRIANHLAANMELAGIDVRIDPMAPDVLLREVLVNSEFDIYVAPYDAGADPDELWALLHSQFVEEAGWQNPFGFSSSSIDDLLDAQRTATNADTRESIVEELQFEIINEQPFSVVAIPDHIGAFRTDRFTDWPTGGLRTPADYLVLDRTDESARLELLLRDPRITRNRNPIAVEHRESGVLTGLLYEPLLRELDNEPTPWLARNVEWTSTTTTETVAHIDLRETPWHDGEPLTAGDVAFTYEFLADTSLGEFESPVPTPWLRGPVAMVSNLSIEDERALEITIQTPNRTVAERALQVPILPEHEWRDQSEPADVAGFDIVGGTTEALVWTNEEPVGSGPFRFVEATADQELILERFDDHFLHRGGETDDALTTGDSPNGDADESDEPEAAEDQDADPGRIPEPYDSGIGFEEVRFRVVPSNDAAVAVLADGDADSAIGGLQASVVPRVVRTTAIGLSVVPSTAFHHIGYNCGQSPLHNYRFRQALAHLIDREYLLQEAYGGYATPTETPVREPWVPDELEWNGESQLPFVGSDGELDVERARQLFRDAGMQYDDDQLVRRG